MWKTGSTQPHDVDDEKRRRSNLLTIYVGFLGTDLRPLKQCSTADN